MAGRRRGEAVALIGLYILLPLSFTTLYFIGNLYSFVALFELYNLSIITGATAYILFMAQFLLSARLPFIERVFPQDRLLAFHGTMGMVLGGLVLSHFIIKYITILRYATIPTFQSALGFGALVIFALLSPAALLILQGRAKKGPKSPPYARARRRHNFFALAGLLAVVHVYLATSTWTLSLKLITLAWGLFCLGAYVWHKVLRPRKSFGLELAEVERLTPDVTAYRFIAPGGDHPQRRSGQFGYFIFYGDTPGKEEHPFTVASSGEDGVEIIVKGSGDYTRLMHETPVGTKVAFDGPYGHFHPHGIPEGTPLTFIAGGIGITPFLSMIRDADLRKKYPLRLIWSVRNPEDIEAAKDAVELGEANSIDLHIFYTRQSPLGEKNRLGRIGTDALSELIRADMRDRAPVFICGPQGFGATIRRSLKELGVPKSLIREEKFSW